MSVQTENQTGNPLDVPNLSSTGRRSQSAPPVPAAPPTVKSVSPGTSATVTLRKAEAMITAGMETPSVSDAQASSALSASPSSERPEATEEQHANNTPIEDHDEALSIDELKALRKMPSQEGQSFLTAVRRSVDPTFRRYEIEQAVEKMLDAEIERLIAQLQDLTDGEDGLQLIIAILNQKGGSGKSSDTTSEATILGDYTGQAITVLDNNQTKGNTASRLGIKKTLSIRQAMRQLKAGFSHSDIASVLGHHAVYRNVRVIDSDDAEARAGRPVVRARFKQFVLRQKVGCHTLLIDGGNEVDSVQTEVATEIADVFRFVAVPWIASATADCKDTMAHFRQIYPTKVAHSVIVLSGCKEVDMNLDYWAQFFDHPAEQIVLIPYDPIFEPLTETKTGSSERDVWAMDHADFQKPTLLASLRREIVTLEQAAKLRKLPKDTAPSHESEGNEAATPSQQAAELLAQFFELAGGDSDTALRIVSEYAVGMLPDIH